MPTESHPTDQELLQSADGGLPSGRTAQIRVHLTACWDCRARMAELEGVIAEFARAHRQSFDSELPPIAGPRALLRARLAELSSKPKASSWRQFVQFMFASRGAAYLSLALLAISVVGQLFSDTPSCTHQTHRLLHSCVGSFQILTSRRAPRAAFR
jgi:anti-sigma factor RsiW